MKTARLMFSVILVFAICGCRAHVVRVILVNKSTRPISTIVVDYPGATFGVNQLDPGKTFQYRIKPLETGVLKIQFTDADGHGHHSTGTALHRNDEGQITVRLSQEQATVSRFDKFGTL